MYNQPTCDIVDALHRLRDHIRYVPERLMPLPEIDLTRKVPDTWSRKEILGHLIDSAINNLKRFTDAQLIEGAYMVQGYDQNKLVVINHYHDLPLGHLLALWSSLNMQIVYVTEAMQDKVSIPIRFERMGHPPTEQSDQTLGWLIEDYVAHLEHHLKKLL